MSDNDNSTVNDMPVTNNQQEQPMSEKGGVQKGIDLLKQLMANKEDYVNKPLSRTKAAELAGMISDAKNKYSISTIYAARKKVADELQSKLTESSKKSIQAEFDIDDLIAGAKEISTDQQTTPEIGGQGGSQELITEPKKEKKPSVPIDPKMLKTVSDAFLGAVFGAYKEVGKEIPKEQQDALKTTYNTTYEAYGVSIPKWALIPLCIAATIVILGLPMRREIQEGIIAIKDMITGNNSTEALR